jgi:hypothetical protein
VQIGIPVALYNVSMNRTGHRAIMFLLIACMLLGSCAPRAAPVSAIPGSAIAKGATRDSKPLTLADVVERLYQPSTDTDLVFVTGRVVGLKRLFTSRVPGSPGVSYRLANLRSYTPQPEDRETFLIIMNDPEASVPQRFAAAYFLLALDEPAAKAFVLAGIYSSELAICHNAVEVLARRAMFDQPARWEIDRLRELLTDARLHDPAKPSPAPSMWHRDMAESVRQALSAEAERNAAPPEGVSRP